MRTFFTYDKINYGINILPSASKVLNNGDNMQDYEFCTFIRNDSHFEHVVSNRKTIIASIHPETSQKCWLVPKVCITTEKE